MINSLVSGLLLLGGIYIGLGENNTHGIIVLLTLLLICAISIVIGWNNGNSEHFENQRPTVVDGKCMSDGKDVSKIWWNDGSNCYQGCPSNSQSRDSNGFCYCGQGGANQECTEGTECVGGICVAKPKQMEVKSEPVQPQPSVQQPEVQTQVEQQSQPQVQTKPQFEQTCRRILKQAPVPPFTKIKGYAGDKIESVQFNIDDEYVVESGSNTNGIPFSVKCPSGNKIVSYSVNNNGNSENGGSIFGGIGPFYCSDGTMINKNYGQPTDVELGKKPESILNKYSYISDEVVPYESGMKGTIIDSTLDECAQTCNDVKNCGAFSFLSENNQCNLMTTIDKNKMVAGKGGRTYTK